MKNHSAPMFLISIIDKVVVNLVYEMFSSVPESTIKQRCFCSSFYYASVMSSMNEIFVRMCSTITDLVFLVLERFANQILKSEIEIRIQTNKS